MNLLPIIHSFIELAQVDSTNNYAMAKVHEGMTSQGTVYFAHEQWAGKGQRGKTWSSNPGDNIVMSTVLEPVFLPVTQQFALSACVALACCDLLAKYTIAEDVSIKWPNDLYWRDRKAGGILIENVFKAEQWQFAVAGTGININQTTFPETAKNPVSLKQITGRHFDAVTLARELADNLGNRYEQLQEGKAGVQLQQYNSVLFGRSRTIRLKKGSAVFETVIQEVTAGGELVTKDSLPRQFRVGEVEWVL